MANETGVEGGAAPGWVTCGCVVAAWVMLTHRVQALRRRVDGVARRVELARRDADRRLRAMEEQVAATAAVVHDNNVATKAAAEVVELVKVRHRVQQMIQQAESLRHSYDEAPPQ